MVSRREQERQQRRAERERVRAERQRTEDIVFEAVTGRRAPVRDPAAINSADVVRDQVITAYGRGRRGGPDTAAAAQDLGVSQRSVQRWLSGQTGLSPEHRQGLQRAAIRSARTKTGRRRALSQQPRPTGRDMKVKGSQGPSEGGVAYSRDRTVTRQLTADQVEDLQSRWTEDGHDGAMTWLNGNMQEYLEGWRIERLDGLDFD